jgi:hypothetical protein
MKIFLLFFSAFLLCSVGCAVHQQYKVIDQELHLFLKNNEALKVYLHTSIDEYAPREAIKDESGLWVAVLPADVEFKYFYIIDGKAFTPECSMKEKDDFGSVNCVYIPLLGMP